jgi:hypothetical protein
LNPRAQLAIYLRAPQAEASETCLR